MPLRRVLLFAIVAVLSTAAPDTLRGKLTHRSGQPPAVTTSDGKLIALDGDKDTLGVLGDSRLAGAEMELRGRFAGDRQFLVGPIHTRAIHVHKNGKALMVTYWCDVCAIRTYTPGKCWCCQQNTELDLRESLP